MNKEYKVATKNRAEMLSDEIKEEFEEFKASGYNPSKKMKLGASIMEKQIEVTDLIISVM